MSRKLKPVGVIGGKGTVNYRVLFDLDAFDKSELKGVKLKAGERIFRYATRVTMAGGMIPLIKVNLDKGLMYFLTQDSAENGETYEFETRGEKLTFSRMIEESVDVSKVNKLIEGIAKALDEGVEFDYEAKGEVINQLSEEGIKWDRSLLNREQMSKLGVKFDI